MLWSSLLLFLTDMLSYEQQKDVQCSKFSKLLNFLFANDFRIFPENWEHFMLVWNCIVLLEKWSYCASKPSLSPCFQFPIDSLDELSLSQLQFAALTTVILRFFHQLINYSEVGYAVWRCYVVKKLTEDVISKLKRNSPTRCLNFVNDWQIWKILSEYKDCSENYSYPPSPFLPQ